MGTIMISNELNIKGDRTINEILINKHIMIRLLLQHKVSFIQIKLAANLYFMPFINWYLMRITHIFHSLTSNSPNKTLLCFACELHHFIKFSAVFDLLNKVVTQTSFPSWALGSWMDTALILHIVFAWWGLQKIFVLSPLMDSV